MDPVATPDVRRALSEFLTAHATYRRALGKLEAALAVQQPLGLEDLQRRARDRIREVLAHNGPMNLSRLLDLTKVDGISRADRRGLVYAMADRAEVSLTKQRTKGRPATHVGIAPGGAGTPPNVKGRGESAEDSL
ncbi:MAG TPA: hypothetical protein VJP59_07970 [Gemmatimonadota bacterium]|nr:hypothetical protein [Gemmatimonadota bacterium]